MRGRGGIWEKLRSSLCISGEHRRGPQSRPPPDHAAGGDQGGASTEDLDLLSALPDDVLLLVLNRLPSAADAARTSVLSRRWRRLWTHLPVLLFPPRGEPLNSASGLPAARTSALLLHWRRLRAHLPRLRSPAPAPVDPRGVARTALAPADPLGGARAALAAHAAPALRLLAIAASGADPGDAAAAVFLLAATRLTGCLLFDFKASEGTNNLEALERAEATDEGAIKLPCFEKAEWILLRLGYLGLALPPSGVFAKLTLLRLEKVQLDGPCNLGSLVSSERCPFLQYLYVLHARGVSNLDIRSESLLILDLEALQGLQQLTIVAPMLRALRVANSFVGRQPAANITVPLLITLTWVDAYDPTSVQLGKLAQLQHFSTVGDLKIKYPNYPLNRNPVMLLQHFRKIPNVYLFINYPPVNTQYLEEIITFLPNIENLHFGTSMLDHAFGPYLFHLLSISSGIRKLSLWIRGDIKVKAPACSEGCVCHQPRDWETEELSLDSLQEIEIRQCRGAAHELAFLKRLLRWASALTTVTIDFDPSVVVREELCQELLGLSKPGPCMKVYFYRDGAKVMYTPVS